MCAQNWRVRRIEYSTGILDKYKQKEHYGWISQNNTQRNDSEGAFECKIMKTFAI